MSAKKLSSMEIDAIGEILNISLGASATAISTMLDARVDITTPVVQVRKKEEFEFKDLEPAVGVEIVYIEGLTGSNLMLLKRDDVRVIVEMLMGMEIPKEEFELDEMNISAICEVMNQMMGASATALSELLSKTVNISTPVSFEIESSQQFKDKYFDEDTPMVVIGFTLRIAEKMESEFINLMPIGLAKELVGGFFSDGVPDEEDDDEEEDIVQAAPEGLAAGMLMPEVAEQPLAAAQAESMPQPGAAMQPEMMGHPGAAVQPGMMGQPGAVMQPGMMSQPGAVMQPETMGQPNVAVQPGMMSQTGAVMQPEMMGQPNAAVQPGMIDQPNAAVQPEMMSQPNVPVQPAYIPQTGAVQQTGAGTMDPQFMNSMTQMMDMMRQQMELQQSQIQQMKQTQAAPKKIKVNAAARPNLEQTPADLEQQESNLDLIMGVPLEVSVEIGRTKKLVKDVLELNKGSLVVLDKLAGEQVDLFVNGLCIAQGDVVVVDDNFGIRITEILADEIPLAE